jgi:hypothetical protein
MKLEVPRKENMPKSAYKISLYSRSCGIYTTTYWYPEHNYLRGTEAFMRN